MNQWQLLVSYSFPYRFWNVTVKIIEQNGYVISSNAMLSMDVLYSNWSQKRDVLS